MNFKTIFSALVCAAMLVGFTACEGVMSDFDKEALKQEILDELREELKGEENQGNESEGENPVEDNNPEENPDDSEITYPDNSKEVNGHNAVDLGVPSGTLWATCNVGATSFEEYGDYFAWGETASKSEYSWDTYKFGLYNYENDWSSFTKYNPTDGKTTLDPSDDVARVIWGEPWRMPSKEDWEELRAYCEWTWKLEANRCIEVKGRNGNVIYFPLTEVYEDNGVHDHGYYWSSEIYMNLGVPRYNEAWIIWLVPYDDGHIQRDIFGWSRANGLTIRPVCSGK